MQTYRSVAKLAAEHMAAVINDRLGWRGADPQYVPKLGYTGRVILSPRAAEEIAVLLTAPALVGGRRFCVTFIGSDGTLSSFTRSAACEHEVARVVAGELGIMDEDDGAVLHIAEVA